MSFKDWMQLVDRHIIGLCGVSTSDLPDQPYRDAFDDGWDPGDYAADVMSELLSEF